jgi:vitellogenic carboxypeptidase-like protein
LPVIYQKTNYLSPAGHQFLNNLLFQFNPEKAPVLLWLQGGPGGSSLFGLFVEHGPFIVRKDFTTLGLRSTSWALTHNVIYIDNPVGTGK